MLFYDLELTTSFSFSTTLEFLLVFVIYSLDFYLFFYLFVPFNKFYYDGLDKLDKIPLLLS